MKPVLNILIVDDQPGEHVLYEDYLADDRTRNYAFSHAYNAAEAEVLCAGKPDCVLLDYHLPDKDGIEVLQQIAARHPLVPVVMLTGQGSEATALIAMRSGAHDYLSKDAVTPASLMRTIDRAIERARLLAAMETVRGELAQSNQDLERFATVLAHDLKSPLRAITQHLELIHNNKHNVLDEKSLKSMGFVMDGARRMRELIEALLDYSRAGFAEKTLVPVDCNQLFIAVRANLSAAIEERAAQVTADLLPTVVADKNQLLQLFENLLANGLKFCDAPPRIHVSVTPEPGGWRFAVKDNGIGIAPHNLEKVFVIFRRVHSADDYPGMGVGLAVCERVVKNHGGHIWAESEFGKGSTFFFTLPEAAVA